MFKRPRPYHDILGSPHPVSSSWYFDGHTHMGIPAPNIGAPSSVGIVDAVICTIGTSDLNKRRNNAREPAGKEALAKVYRGLCKSATFYLPGPKETHISSPMDLTYST